MQTQRKLISPEKIDKIFAVGYRNFLFMTARGIESQWRVFSYNGHIDGTMNVLFPTEKLFYLRNRHTTLVVGYS